MNGFVLPDESVLRAREKLVLDHFRDEVAQDWDATLSTFPHPHYELIASMQVHEGDVEVRAYYDDTRVAFLTNATRSLRSVTASTPSSWSSGFWAHISDLSARSRRRAPLIARA